MLTSEIIMWVCLVGCFVGLVGYELNKAKKGEQKMVDRKLRGETPRKIKEVIILKRSVFILTVGQLGEIWTELRRNRLSENVRPLDSMWWDSSGYVYWTTLDKQTHVYQKLKITTNLTQRPKGKALESYSERDFV